ncbi:hypothetical protein Tco_1263888 [Tanacetum coccineum]
MELENSQNNALAKLPMLKLGEYEMWEIRIKQYFQIQDYALWEVIENGNSWVPIPVTAPESGPSTALKMTVPSTAEEKICKKNDLIWRSKHRSKLRRRLKKALTEATIKHFNAALKLRNISDSIFNTASKQLCTETSTASFSDATVYAFLSTQPQGSQLVYEDLEQLLMTDDILEEDGSKVEYGY